MANTEGLTDEEMLKSMNETIQGWDTTTTRSAAAAATRSQRLVERLDRSMMGERGPAAKVIRKSISTATSTKGSKIMKPKGKVYKATDAPSSLGTQAEQTEIRANDADNKPIVLGNIVERKRRKGQRPKPTVSRPTPPQGFPSLQKPLGTFTPQSTSHNLGASPLAPALQTPISANSSTTTTNTTNTTTKTATSINPPASNINLSDIEAIKLASAKEANQMIAAMTLEEIQETAQELQTLLSPQSLAFFQSRRRKHNPSQPSSSSLPFSSPQPPLSVSTTHSTSLQQDPSLSADQEDAKQLKDNTDDNDEKEPHCSTKSAPVDNHDAERFEKERLAKILSSVKNYDDMDAIYRAEVGEEADDVFISRSHKDDHNNTSNPFEVACDLLRSTAPRQTLWAVRTVRDRLASDFSTGRTVRLPHTQKWPYPTILPVSLRCLLDQAPNRVNGYLLHTYTLEALYLLLRLRCAVEHDTDLVDTTNKDPASVYQLYLGQDSVPSPPLESLYQSAQIKTLAVKDENVAYATASSATTATQDGEKFASDPLWTLLSQMRIIPRMASLFQFHLPDEAWLAATGILAMVAQRSPGAATAMVQHKTLLKDLARVAWDDDPAQASSSRMVVAVLRLWVILARQGRTAAAGLELPPWGMLLGIRHKTGSHLQLWALVLWRVLLRYGLAAHHELEPMMTLAVPHLAVVSQKKMLAAHHFGCWSMVLAAHHLRVVKATDEIVLQHELRQLIKARAWLASFYRQALALLQAPTRHESVSTDDFVLYASCLRLCHQYIVTADDVLPNPPGEYKVEDSIIDDARACLEVMTNLVDSGILSKAITVVQAFFFQETPGEVLDKHEAAVVGFLTSFVTMLRAIPMGFLGEDVNPCESLRSSISEALVSLVSSQKIDASMVSCSPIHLARVGWRNRGRFVLLEMLRLSASSDGIDPYVRMAMGTVALAWFQVGDEALVNRVARMELIRLPADLRSMILGQLQTTPQKQNQVRHSLSINSDYANDPTVPLELQSLRSEADSPGPKRNESNDVGLPLGEFWLWKVLAGSASTDTPTERIVNVMRTTLSMIYELEAADIRGVCHYTTTLSAGSKMYYLLNLCMQREDVLGDEVIEGQIERLRQKYSQNVDSSFVESFANSCISHLSTQLSLAEKEKADSTDSREPTEEEKKLAAALLNDVDDEMAALSGRRLRIVIDFLNDLCTAFCDYGAQYPFFAACLRVFLFPAFPHQIRCELIRRLPGLLHLLSLPVEDQEPSKIARFISEEIENGDVLDTFASCFTKSSAIRSHGLIEFLAVGSMGRALGMAARKDSMDSHRNRLMSLQEPILGRVVDTAGFCSEQKCSPSTLAKFMMDNQVSSMKVTTWHEIVTTLAPARDS